VAAGEALGLKSPSSGRHQSVKSKGLLFHAGGVLPGYDGYDFSVRGETQGNATQRRRQIFR